MVDGIVGSQSDVESEKNPTADFDGHIYVPEFSGDKNGVIISQDGEYLILEDGSVVFGFENDEKPPKLQKERILSGSSQFKVGEVSIHKMAGSGLGNHDDDVGDLMKAFGGKHKTGLTKINLDARRLQNLKQSQKAMAGVKAATQKFKKNFHKKVHKVMKAMNNKIKKALKNTPKTDIHHGKKGASKFMAYVRSRNRKQKTLLKKKAGKKLTSIGGLDKKKLAKAKKAMKAKIARAKKMRQAMIKAEAQKQKAHLGKGAAKKTAKKLKKSKAIAKKKAAEMAVLHKSLKAANKRVQAFDKEERIRENYRKAVLKRKEEEYDPKYSKTFAKTAMYQREEMERLRMQQAKERAAFAARFSHVSDNQYEKLKMMEELKKKRREAALKAKREMQEKVLMMKESERQKRIRRREARDERRKRRRERREKRRQMEEKKIRIAQKALIARERAITSKLKKNISKQRTIEGHGNNPEVIAKAKALIVRLKAELVTNKLYIKALQHPKDFLETIQSEIIQLR
jgi:hypothetical protein